MDDSILKSKFSNIFINLLYSIMINDITKVRHFLSDEVASEIEKIIERNKSNNEKQMYDELNVKDIMLTSRETTSTKEIINVTIISRYMDYIIDADTGEYKRGVKDYRVERSNYLTFERYLNAKDRPILFKCPNCGADMDINNSGRCNFCREVVDLSDYEYILTQIVVE